MVGVTEVLWFAPAPTQGQGRGGWCEVMNGGRGGGSEGPEPNMDTWLPQYDPQYDPRDLSRVRT